MDFNDNHGKLLTKHRVPWFVVRYELTLAYRDPWRKNIFLSQYCVSKCLVWIRPKRNIFYTSSKYKPGKGVLISF